MQQATPTHPTMPTAFNPRQVEEPLYQYWLEGGYFTPKVDPSRKPFTIVIPPPNVTGELHYGHAMFVAFQDLIIRWKRMQGYPTLWLPGTDHAGIATQTVVENELAREGLTRFDLGREKLVERVWQWKEKYGGIINHQLRRLGASLDWTRERFTLDPGLSRAVREAFVRLYDRGLIYRGSRIINWCPRCNTALSDLEVDHRESESKLYYVRYQLVRTGEGLVEPDHVVVATTRPETMLGDTGVAVNPKDERYAGLVGRLAILPVIGRAIPVVADAAVDPAFGTGAVKVTPGHDPTDYEIGRRHQLPAINVMNENGTMSAEAGPYAGLDRHEARRRLVAELERQGLLVRIEDYTHSIGHCDRCGTVVEPMISEQWFVRIQPLAEPAIDAVRRGEIRFVPERFARVYFNWMENIRDWCISRQLWWGHQIPVWYCEGCGQAVAAVEKPIACPSCHNPKLRQDPDVLDTWFSSALWPFSTLGWPDDTPDLRYFYPTDVMETGYDILFFWVARMIMMGLECTGQVPFRDVYLHGLLRDEKGEKMSKSKGNVANPLDVIKKYGADALRFTILTGSSPGNDMKLSEDKLEGSRNFVNKLWNAARFVVTTARDDALAAVSLPEQDARYELPDRWILSRLSDVVAQVTWLFDDYQFSEAGRVLHEFVWSEFCDWYIEIAKIRLRGPASRDARLTALHVLYRVLDDTLRLLHPYTPFVTEAIWQNLPARQSALIVVPWPEPGPRDAAAESEMEIITGIIRAIRNARAEFRVEPARRLEAVVVAGNRTRLLAEQRQLVAALARAEPLRITPTLAERPKQALHLVVQDVEVYLPLAGMLDLAAEKARVEEETRGVLEQVARLRARLSEDGFVRKAPPAVVEKERSRLAGFEERLAKLQDRLAALAGQD